MINKNDFKKQTITHAKSYIKNKEKQNFYGDSLMPKMLLVIINELEELNKHKSRIKRKPTAWQEFAGSMLKKGIPIKEISKMYMAQKERSSKR